jgi:hypothetical protein
VKLGRVSKLKCQLNLELNFRSGTKKSWFQREATFSSGLHTKVKLSWPYRPPVLTYKANDSLLMLPITQFRILMVQN